MQWHTVQVAQYPSPDGCGVDRQHSLVTAVCAAEMKPQVALHVLLQALGYVMSQAVVIQYNQTVPTTCTRTARGASVANTALSLITLITLNPRVWW